MLFDPHFTEETVWLREVDGLPKVTQPGRGGVRSQLAPKAAILLDPTAFLSAEKKIEKCLHGFNGWKNREG